jgi:hypothetical protein
MQILEPVASVKSRTTAMSDATKKHLKSLLISSIAAGAAYALHGLSGTDFGVYTPLVVAAAGWAANAIKVWVTTQK